MRNYLAIGLTVVLGMSAAAAPPPVDAAQSAETCNDPYTCEVLKKICANYGGSWGSVTYPDGSMWGVCVH